MSFRRNPWVVAEERYLEGLNNDEKALYKSASAENLLYSTNAAQIRHEENSRSRTAARKLQPLIAAITQYGSALDVISNTAPLFLSPLWGGLRVLLHIASEYDKYYLKLIEMLERIGDVIPRFKTFENLFPKHDQLLYSLSSVYLDIIVFCADAKSLFLKAKTKRSRLPGSGLRALKLVWKPFDRDFGDVLEKFRRHTDKVEMEAQLSHMIEESRERKAQGDERDAQALERAIADTERKRQILLHKEQLQTDLLQRLSQYDHDYKHRMMKKIRHDGTGQWISNSEEFCTWLNETRSSCLWCTGIPGSGKSILTTVIVDTIRRDHLSEDSLSSWFYCDYSESKTLEPIEIIGSLIKQLLPMYRLKMSLEIQLHLEKIYENDRTPDIEELFQAFSMVTQKLSRVFVIIDGLDECKEKARECLLPWLRTLSVSSTVTMKLFIASREEVDIKKALKHCASIQITAERIGNDITAVVEHVVRANVVEEKLCVQDPVLVQEIIDALVHGARGMFLWVTFQLQDICEEVSEEGVRTALQRLPDGLNETFARALQKIQRRGQTQVDIARNIFMWLATAKRTLSLPELQEAVSIRSGDDGLDQRKIPNGLQLIRACGSLVIYDPQENTIKLAHYTIRQFLLSDPTDSEASLGLAHFHIGLRDTDIELGQICMTYLRFSAFSGQIIQRTLEGPSSSDAQLLGSPTTRWVPQMVGFNQAQTNMWNLFTGRTPSNCRNSDIDFNKHLYIVKKASHNLQQYELLDYVKEFWLDHAASFTKNLTEIWKQFENLALERNLLLDFRPWGKAKPVLVESNPLDDSKLECESRYRYPGAFCWALEHAHEPLMILLLSVSFPSEGWYLLNCGEHPLFVASRMGYEQIVEIFLTTFSAPNRTYDKYPPIGPETGAAAIILAISNGHTGTAIILLERYGYLVAPSKWSQWLYLAAEKGNVALVQFLCDPLPVSYRLKGNDYRALHVAIQMGHQDVASYLVTSGGIRPNTRSNDGSTALHFAAELGYYKLVKLLLEKNYKRLLKNKNGWDPLLLAASTGHDAVVKALLHLGSQTPQLNPTLYPGGNTWTPLCIASNNGYAAVVKVLLDAGFGVNIASFGWTPLDLAAQGGHESVVELLLNDNCDAIIDPQTSGLTDRPIHWAARHGNEKMASLLIAKGAQTDGLDIYGCTALEIALSRRHLSVATILSRTISIPTSSKNTLKVDSPSHGIPVPYSPTSTAGGPPEAELCPLVSSVSLVNWKSFKPILSVIPV